MEQHRNDQRRGLGSTVDLAGTLTTHDAWHAQQDGRWSPCSSPETLDNTGSALTLGQAGPLTMDGGTIQGGTADLTSNNLVFFERHTANFAHVAITGDINLATDFAKAGFSQRYHPERIRQLNGGSKLSDIRRISHRNRGHLLLQRSPGGYTGRRRIRTARHQPGRHGNTWTGCSRPRRRRAGR